MINFSIILPTFNRAAFLSKAIESVISQIYTDWELIIIDDGSTDNTRELVSAFTQKDSRIKYIYQENAERSAARNNGIKNASGNYICFIDSDDIFYHTHLQNFAELIEINNFENALYISGVSFNNYNKKEYQFNLNFETPQEFILINSIGTPRTCVSSKILEKEKFNTKIRIGEDKELWVRITKNYNLYFHTKNSFIEVEHENRSINEGIYENLKTLKYIFKTNEIKKSIKSNMLSGAYFTIAKYEIRKNNRFKGLYFVLMSILTMGNKLQFKHKLNVIFKLISFQKLDNAIEIL